MCYPLGQSLTEVFLETCTQDVVVAMSRLIPSTRPQRTVLYHQLQIQHQTNDIISLNVNTADTGRTFQNETEGCSQSGTQPSSAAM